MTEVDERRPTRSLLARHPQLAAVIAAEGLSGAGDAVFWVGLLVWLLDQPNGTSLVALAAVARLGPRVVFAAAGGVFADRYDRRKLVVGLDLARGALMVALALLTSKRIRGRGAGDRGGGLRPRRALPTGLERRHPARRR
jgi:MFS family permease